MRDLDYHRNHKKEIRQYDIRRSDIEGASYEDILVALEKLDYILEVLRKWHERNNKFFKEETGKLETPTEDENGYTILEKDRQRYTFLHWYYNDEMRALDKMQDDANRIQRKWLKAKRQYLRKHNP